jgi:hypothetical protein
MNALQAQRRLELQTALDKINGNITAWAKLERRQPLSCEEMHTIQWALEDALREMRAEEVAP